jgi:hypothetical protein
MDTSLAGSPCKALHGVHCQKAGPEPTSDLRHLWQCFSFLAWVIDPQRGYSIPGPPVGILHDRSRNLTVFYMHGVRTAIADNVGVVFPTGRPLA